MAFDDDLDDGVAINGDGDDGDGDSVLWRVMAIDGDDGDGNSVFANVFAGFNFHAPNLHLILFYV